MGLFTGEYQNLTLSINSPDLCLRRHRHIKENKHQAPRNSNGCVKHSLLLGSSGWKFCNFNCNLENTLLHSPANILLANLAISDFGVGLIVQPAGIVSILMSMQDFLPIHRAICTVFPHSASFLCGVSLVIVTATGLDRLLTLQLHLRYECTV